MVDSRRLFSNFSLVVLGIILIITSFIFWYTGSTKLYFWTVIVLGIAAVIAGLILAIYPKRFVKRSEKESESVAQENVFDSIESELRRSGPSHVLKVVRSNNSRAE